MIISRGLSTHWISILMYPPMGDPNLQGIVLFRTRFHQNSIREQIVEDLTTIESSHILTDIFGNIRDAMELIFHGI